MTSVSVIGNLILPDGRNRLGGYMTTVLVIGNNDNWWNELEHYASTRQCLPNGKMTLPSSMGALSSARQNKRHKYIGVFGAISLTETQC